jgi:hypothetical protein
MASSRKPSPSCRGDPHFLRWTGPSETRILFSRPRCLPTQKKSASIEPTDIQPSGNKLAVSRFDIPVRNVQIKTTKREKTIIKVGRFPITEFRRVASCDCCSNNDRIAWYFQANSETCVQPSDAKWSLQMSEHPQQVTRGTLPSRN